VPASTRGAKRPRSGSDIVTSPSARIVLAVLRIVVGFIFLWTFLDKTFGLGFSTPRQMAWINGGQPAQGFIKGVAVHSPFGSAFELLANPVHEYTRGLLGAVLSIEAGSKRLHQVRGVVPSPSEFVKGDRFAPRSSHPTVGLETRPVLKPVPGTTEHSYAITPELEALLAKEKH